jgi:hypothetical protein
MSRKSGCRFDFNEIRHALSLSCLSRFALASGGVALSCLLLAAPVGAQETDEEETLRRLRGLIPTETQGAEVPSLDSVPLDAETLPLETESPLPDAARAEEEELLRKKRQTTGGGAAEASSGGVAPTANEANARQRQTQRRKGSNVNTLSDRKEKSTRPDTVRGIRALEKTRNTAVNTKGDVPAPLGLSVTSPEIEDAAEEKERRLRRPDPYAPTGIKNSSVLYFPSASIEGGYDTNPLKNGSSDQGSFFARTALGLRMDGDFGDAKLAGNLDARYDAFVSVEEANRPEIESGLSYEKEIGDARSVEAALRLNLTTESTTDANLPSGATERALRADVGATLGATQRLGRASLRLRGTIERDQFADVTLGSSSASQSDRNATELGLGLRAAYETSPGFQPFVDISASRRMFDERRDRNGLERGSNNGTLRAGFAFDINEAITGEVSAGYAFRQFDDSSLDPLHGLVLGATLNFAATPLTRLSLGAETALEDSTEAGANGSIERSISLGIEHDLLRNLQLNASLSIGQRQPDEGNSDWTIRSGFGAEYTLVPELVLTGRYAFEQQWAAEDSSSYDAHTLLFGVKVQR